MLSNLRILDFSSVLAGPAVGTFFAELGAEVIKVENVSSGGDVTRQWKLAGEDPESPVSAYFSAVNYGKSYRQLNVFNAADREEFERLIDWCDIFITNQKSSSLEKMKLNHELLCAHYPKLIYGQITGFESEPARAAYDVVLQAETGYMFMNGTPETAPVKLPLAFMDLLAAHQLKEGLLVALLKKSETGKGSYVYASLEVSGIASLANQASNYLMAGHIPQPIGSLHPNIAPYGETFITQDERKIVLAVGSDRQFAAMCSILGCEDLADRAEFKSNPERVKNRKLLYDMLSTWFKKYTRDHLMRLFIAAHVPAGAVKSLDEVFNTDLAGKMILNEEIDGIQTSRVRSVAFSIHPSASSDGVAD
jgi:crotonobetainyl-CoA:carnitine CoA-transferase CaiB-like acyl-CoA transferase